MRFSIFKILYITVSILVFKTSLIPDQNNRFQKVNTFGFALILIMNLKFGFTDVSSENKKSVILFGVILRYW